MSRKTSVLVQGLAVTDNDPNDVFHRYPWRNPRFPGICALVFCAAGHHRRASTQRCHKRSGTDCLKQVTANLIISL